MKHIKSLLFERPFGNSGIPRALGKASLSSDLRKGSISLACCLHFRAACKAAFIDHRSLLVAVMRSRFRAFLLRSLVAGYSAWNDPCAKPKRTNNDRSLTGILRSIEYSAISQLGCLSGRSSDQHAEGHIKILNAETSRDGCSSSDLPPKSSSLWSESGTASIHCFREHMLPFPVCWQSF